MRGPHNFWRIIRIGATFERSGAMSVALKALNAPRVLRIIEFAKGLAEKLNKNTVDVIHLFLSLLYENDGVATSILSEYGLNFDKNCPVLPLSVKAKM